MQIPAEASNDWLRWRTKATPHKQAMIFGDRRWTFAELDELTNRMAGWLVELDLPENGRVGILMQNRPEYVVLIYAASRLGLTLVTFNTRLTSAEVEWQIGFTACELVIVDEGNEQKLEGFLGVEVLQVPTIDQLQYLSANGKWLMVNDEWRTDSIQAIVFTSGTTGRPKAVPVRYDQHFVSAMGSSYRLGVENNDIWLSVLPLYHVGGMAVVFRSLIYGTAFDLHPKFDLMEINEALQQEEVRRAAVIKNMHRLRQLR